MFSIHIVFFIYLLSKNIDFPALLYYNIKLDGEFMFIDILTLYLQIFFILSFALYIIYVLVVVPLYKKLPVNITKIYDSVMFDFAVMMIILMVFYVINYSFFHIKHTLFISIDLMITLSSGVLLSCLISYFTVNSFNISKTASYIAYIILFLFLFLLYIAVVFKPYA